MAVVEHQSVVGLLKWRRFAMSVNIVALFNILEYSVKVGRHSLSLEFFEASLCTNLSRSSNEYLQFSIWEHHGTNVATIHNDALFVAHSLLLLNKLGTYKRQGSYRTYVLRHLKRSYFFLYNLVVKACLRLSCLWIKLERDVNFRQQALKFLHIDVAFGVEQTMTHGKQCNCTIHSTCVYVYIAHLLSKILSHSALSARRVSVDGYHNFFHIVISFYIVLFI